MPISRDSSPSRRSSIDPYPWAVKSNPSHILNRAMCHPPAWRPYPAGRTRGMASLTKESMKVKIIKLVPKDQQREGCGWLLQCRMDSGENNVLRHYAYPMWLISLRIDRDEQQEPSRSQSRAYTSSGPAQKRRFTMPPNDLRSSSDIGHLSNEDAGTTHGRAVRTNLEYVSILISYWTRSC